MPQGGPNQDSATALVRLGSCALGRCDALGRGLLEGGDAMADLLGVEAAVLRDGLGDILGGASPEGYRRRVEGLDPPSTFLPYLHPRHGLRWLSLAFEDSPATPGERLLLVRDETPSLPKDLFPTYAPLPMPDGGSFECSARTFPGEETSTSFFELLSTDPAGFDLVIGAVEGRSVETEDLRPLIKGGYESVRPQGSAAAGKAPGPEEVCAAVEARVRSAYHSGTPTLSLAFCRFDARNRTLTYSAGGRAALLIHTARSGQTWRIEGARKALGSQESLAFPTYLIPLEAGDLCLLASPGVTELRNRLGLPLGAGRLGELLDLAAVSATPKVVESLLEACLAYAGGRTGDLCLACVRDDRPEGTPRVDRSRELLLGPGAEGGVEETEADLEADLRIHAPTLGEADLAGIRLACHEALANILGHALPPGGGGTAFRWWILPELLGVEIEYDGPEYAWSAPRESPLDRLGESGYGLIIMGRIMDSVAVAYGPSDRKRLIMVKRLNHGREGA